MLFVADVLVTDEDNAAPLHYIAKYKKKKAEFPTDNNCEAIFILFLSLSNFDKFFFKLH